jgi:site-specific recombinase XerD
MFSISVSEAKRLLSGINLASTWGKRDYLLILLFVHTGLRVGEMTRLRVQDVIDPVTTQPREEVYLSARITKTRKARVVPLNETAQKCINKVLEFNKGLHFSTAPGAPLFPGKNHDHLPTREVQRMVQKLRRKVGMSDKITPHVLRHTFATEVVRQGGTLPAVKEILGHKYMTSTQVYTHTTKQEKRAAVKGLFQKREVS